MKKRLTLKQLTSQMPTTAEISAEDNENFAKALFSVLKEELLKEDHIRWYPFGSFKTIITKARNGVNPQTGEPVEIPAQNRPSFTASQQLKDIVNKDYAHLKIEYIYDKEVQEPEPITVKPEENIKVLSENIVIKDKKKKSKLLAIIPILLIIIALIIISILRPGRNDSEDGSGAIPLEEPEKAPEVPATKIETPVSKAETPPVETREIHRVSQGDSLYALAETYWGDSKLWPIIYFDNKEEYRYPDLILVDQEVIIAAKPDPSDRERLRTAYQYTYEHYQELLASAETEEERLFFQDKITGLAAYASQFSLVLND